MTWVSWRLQRTETLVAFGIVALLAALLVPTGLHIASAYDQDRVADCIGKNTFACNNAIESFTARFDHIISLVGWFNLVPGMIGILLAAPLLLDLENGTYRLAWTQGVTRKRWLAGRLGLAVGAALLAALAMIVLITWWRSPLDHLRGRMNTGVFEFEGTTTFGYVLFALALALAVGVLWRRTVPALVVGFAGYVVSRLAVEGWLRQHYRAPLTATWPARSNGPDLSHAWVILQRPSDKFGHPLQASLLFRDCLSPTKCLAHKTVGYTHAVYQPESRFWLFQGIETALFAGVAVALILLAAWWIHERAE